MGFADQVEDVVERAYGHYRAGAVRRGRRAEWPYVPVYRHHKTGKHQTTQVKGWAFATREEALAKADEAILWLKDQFRRDLMTPGHRAQRAQWGLPSEIPVTGDPQ